MCYWTLHYHYHQFSLSSAERERDHQHHVVIPERKYLRKLFITIHQHRTWRELSTWENWKQNKKFKVYQNLSFVFIENTWKVNNDPSIIQTNKQKRCSLSMIDLVIFFYFWNPVNSVDSIIVSHPFLFLSLKMDGKSFEIPIFFLLVIFL